MDRITKTLLACLLALTAARADQTIFQPMIFSTGSSLTIQSGITATFASGSTVNFTGATLTGLPNDLPTGGTTGQVLSKNSATNYDVGWSAAGGAGAPASATYLTQTADATLTNEVALGTLATGLVKSTTSTGAISIVTDNSANWDTAFTDRLKWDGGATGLTAATGRTSLGATTSGAAVFTIAPPAGNAWIKLTSIGGAVTEDAATTRASIGAGTGNGSVTNIATTSPISGGPISSSGTLSLLTNVDLALGASQTITLNDSNVNVDSSVLALKHYTSGTAATNFGTTLWFLGEDASGVLDRDMGQIFTSWSNAASASRTSFMGFRTVNSTTQAEQMRLWGSGGVSLGNSVVTTDPGLGFFNVPAAGGYKVNNVALAFSNLGGSVSAAQMPALTGDVTSSAGGVATTYNNAVPTTKGGLPTGGTVNQTLVKNTSTNYDASWKSGGFTINNESTATQSSCCAADTTIVGSSIVVGANNWTVGGVYHVRFEVVKTAAGTATPALQVRIGTAGTPSDAIVQGGSLGFAGTATADTAILEMDFIVRTIGASATSAGNIMVIKNGSTTGFMNTGNPVFVAQQSANPTFNSTTATTISTSLNGGASFSGTIAAVTASWTP